MSDVSMLILPIVAKGTTLGFFNCIRQAGTRRFDAYDMEMGMEFASRAAVFFDNAGRYNREHATALTLQRSMLPTGLSAPSSVEVRHRYLPGSKLVEVGGDWYESIKLPGARVALVVGDVAGHGPDEAALGVCLRVAWRTLVLSGRQPDQTLACLQQVLEQERHRKEVFATVAMLSLDVASGSGSLRLAGARRLQWRRRPERLCRQNLRRQ